MTVLIALAGPIVGLILLDGIVVGNQIVKTLCLFALIGGPSIIPVLWIRDSCRSRVGKNGSRILTVIGGFMALVALICGLSYALYKVWSD